ncbi:MAG: response regulator [Nitrospinae bacterium]|nr:response regulator [Nitrospinota bacterium]
MKPLTILIIEDDESMRDTIEAILKKEYRIIQTESGKEALKKLEENEIQIALIDINLPDIRGTKILKIIKRERPDMECIMMSVINDAETAAECFKNGALDYFTKEFDYDIFR